MWFEVAFDENVEHGILPKLKKKKEKNYEINKRYERRR